jgi:hypothetical protein
VTHGASGTDSHWRVFAPGTAGVCIRLRPRRPVRAGRGRLATAPRPLLTRHPFAPGQEARRLWESRREQRCLPGCARLPGYRSALIDNAAWIERAAAAD